MIYLSSKLSVPVVLTPHFDKHDDSTVTDSIGNFFNPTLHGYKRGKSTIAWTVQQYAVQFKIPLSITVYIAT